MTGLHLQLSPLRRRMIEDMTVRNLSPATQRFYLHAVRKFSRYFGRSPDRLDIEGVRAYQVYLVSQGISWPALNQTVCALRFFYGITLRRIKIPEGIPYTRELRELPITLGADEVVRFLEAVPSLKTRTALTTAYGAGLRDKVTAFVCELYRQFTRREFRLLQSQSNDPLSDTIRNAVSHPAGVGLPVFQALRTISQITVIPPNGMDGSPSGSADLMCAT